MSVNDINILSTTILLFFILPVPQTFYYYLYTRFTEEQKPNIPSAKRDCFSCFFSTFLSSLISKPMHWYFLEMEVDCILSWSSSIRCCSKSVLLITTFVFWCSAVQELRYHVLIIQLYNHYVICSIFESDFESCLWHELAFA